MKHDFERNEEAAVTECVLCGYIRGEYNYRKCNK